MSKKIEDAKQILNDYLKKIKPYVHKATIVGSIAREHKKVNDADLVIIPKKNFFEQVQYIGHTPKKKKFINFIYKSLPINIWIADKKSFEPTVLHFTLGKHILRLKEEAKKRGLKLNRYGLFKDDKLITNKKDQILKILKKGGISPPTA